MLSETDSFRQVLTTDNINLMLEIVLSGFYSAQGKDINWAGLNVKELFYNTDILVCDQCDQ